jgi:hypothetical protein
MHVSHESNKLAVQKYSKKYRNNILKRLKKIEYLISYFKSQ